jgi:hypothetical protein
MNSSGVVGDVIFNDFDIEDHVERFSERSYFLVHLIDSYTSFAPL